MMLENEHYESRLPGDIYSEIKEICNVVKEIQQETSGIMYNRKMADTTAQLNDVLQSTENATNTILDAATAIKKISDGINSSQEHKPQIENHVNAIYEACTFQDITGQRIQRVLKHMSLLEERLIKLSKTAKVSAENPSPSTPDDVENSALTNGPALTADTPSQADIDKLFD